MPIYTVVLTVRTPTRDVTSYSTRQRAGTIAAAKWAVIKKWATLHNGQHQQIDIAALELTATRSGE